MKAETDNSVMTSLPVTGAVLHRFPEQKQVVDDLFVFSSCIYVQPTFLLRSQSLKNRHDKAAVPLKLQHAKGEMKGVKF